MAGDDPIRVGVSACLLGQEVRYDGRHKRSAFVADVLARFVELVPVCPEVELGLGVPREPIRLERAGRRLRLVAPGSGIDHTEAMQAWAAERLAALEPLGLCGYVLKSRSPSCGMAGVEVHPAAGGRPTKEGVGLFAAALMARQPLLPVEEEGRLEDPRVQEQFVERLFAWRRLRALFRPRWRVADLVRFHTAGKLLLLAHDPQAYRALGRLVASAKGRPRAELADAYRQGYMRALARPATTGKHVNVLQHMAGYLRDLLPAPQRRELERAIEDYRRARVPWTVPAELIRHHARAQGVSYVQGQVYLEAHPAELMARGA